MPSEHNSCVFTFSVCLCNQTIAEPSQQKSTHLTTINLRCSTLSYTYSHPCAQCTQPWNSLIAMRVDLYTHLHSDGINSRKNFPKNGYARFYLYRFVDINLLFLLLFPRFFFFRLVKCARLLLFMQMA